MDACMNPLDWSIVTGPVPVVALVLGVLALLCLLYGRGGWWKAAVPVVVLSAAAAIALAWLVDDVWKPFADPLPTSVVVYIGAGLCGMALAIARLPFLRTWGKRIGALLAGLVVLVAAGAQVNALYREYSTPRIALESAFGESPVYKGDTRPVPLVTPGPGQSVAEVWQPPSDMPAHGKIYESVIPGEKSKFKARPGYLYLPPAYLSSPRAQLPVLILLAGQPGSPSGWVDSGQLGPMMDAFAAAHKGLAPVVVIPDDLGDPLANPMCMDSRLGNAETYLTVDVPAWITKNLHVRPPDRGWAIAGFSQGGTCSIQLAVRAPKLFPSFIDIAGQNEPTLGDRKDTVDQAFGGDKAAYARVNPADIMATRRFPDSAGVFVAGTDDHTYTPQQRQMYETARRAGMNVVWKEIPGGHSWQVWGPGLGQDVPWLAERMGIT
jgi:S-formylglutathione hydrolase FrmB